MSEITGADINAVLRLVKSITTDGDAQLTILGRAFVVACRSCGVCNDDALAGMYRLLSEPAERMVLVDLITNTTARSI